MRSWVDTHHAALKRLHSQRMAENGMEVADPAATMEIRRWSAFLAYYSALIQFAPYRFMLGSLLTLVSTFVSGASMLMVVPLLHFTGWLPGGTQTGLVGMLLARLPSGGGPLPLFVTMALYVLLIAISSGLSWWRQDVMVRFDLDYQLRLRSGLTAAVVRCEWTHLATRRLQRVQHMVNAGLDRVASLTRFAIQMSVNIIVIAVFFILSLFVSAPLTLAATGIALVLFVIHARSKAFFLGKREMESGQILYEELSSFLEGVKPAKAGNLTERFVTRYESLLREEQGYVRRYARGEASSRFSFNITVAIVIAAVFLVSINWMGASAASLLVLLLLLSRLMPHVVGLLEALRQVLNTMPAYEEMRAMVADLDAHREPPAGSGRLRSEKVIRLDGVCFTYPAGGRAGLHDVSCDIPARGVTVVIGPSGAGKTTLADVLLGLIVPQSGSVLVDGIPLTPENASGWRAVSAYVPQDPFLFHDSIRANLAWAVPEATEKQMWDALEDASAAAFVRALPNQLDTPVGDRGNRLSGGERQRLALARALLRQPELLVLDEATSALDAHNEEMVHASLRRLRGRVTIVFISHRAAALELADSVLRLHDGGLAKSGTDDLFSASASGPAGEPNSAEPPERGLA
jgi:ATP-binding cassette subfamily C protein